MRMPAAISEEKPANNLASLTMSDALNRLMGELIGQWQLSPTFKDLEQYGIRPLDRVLFYGPPGNGKTVASQVIANKLDCPLYRVCCEALLVSSFGGTQKNIAEVLDWMAAQGTAVVLWDECESLFPDRSTAGGGECTRELVSSMQIFWQRLDRWQTPQLFVLATNLIDRIDPALSSRIELQLEFGPPTQQQALDVLAYWTEVFHEYGSADWSPPMREQIDRNILPESFRSLWQLISSAVRSHVCKGA